MGRYAPIVVARSDLARLTTSALATTTCGEAYCFCNPRRRFFKPNGPSKQKLGDTVRASACGLATTGRCAVVADVVEGDRRVGGGGVGVGGAALGGGRAAGAAAEAAQLAERDAKLPAHAAVDEEVERIAQQDEQIQQ